MRISYYALQRLIVALVLPSLTASVNSEPVSKAPNFGSIANTRHNMTQSFLGSNANWMSLSRNNYGEVCVYCHTPHGANTGTSAPLWNRTIKATTYTTYNQLATNTLTQPIAQPGAASLPCLSCHDGQTAIDSIINMPGSGRYSATQGGSQDNSFLDTWPGGPGSSFYGGHGTLSNTAATMNNYGECQSCHSTNGDQHDPSTTPKFDVFFIGTDLRDDHPVGVTYPTSNGLGTDWKTPGGATGNLSNKFFDENGNGHMDKTDIRLYDSGSGASVECATCHDPHGVPGSNGTFNPSFLRKSNAQSAVCMTCHAK